MVNEKRLIDAEVVRHKINSFAASVVYRGNAEMFTGKDSCNPHEYTRGYEKGILDAQKNSVRTANRECSGSSAV